MAQEWHGRENEEEIGSGGLPSQPREASTESVDDLLERHGEGPFAVVRFVGRYGFGCPNARQFEERNISYGDAKEKAWDAFGLCGGNVSFYDHDGNFVMEKRAPLP